MVNLKENSAGISANILKVIAICAMFIDHVAWVFVPANSLLGSIMHFIGRMTMPIMSFFIAEGFYHTKSVKKYAIRLLIFAIISQIPFAYFQTATLEPVHSTFSAALLSFNVIFTQLYGLLILWMMKSSKSSIGRVPKNILIFCLIALSLISDWSIFGVAFIIIFGLDHGDFKKQAIRFSTIAIVLVITSALVTSWYEVFSQLGMFLALLFLYFYNGKRGGKWLNKWVFYWFYPAHLLIIGFLKFYIFK